MTADALRRWTRRANRLGPEMAMGVGTALSRLTGLARIIALSYALGVTPLADAYNVANTTPNMIYDLVLGGVLSATLIPLFVSRLHRDERLPGAGDGDDDAWAAISAVLTVSAVVLALGTALVAATAGLLVSGYTVATPAGIAGGEHVVAVRLLQLFAPQVFLYGVIAMATAVLNTVRRFALATFAPIANNLVLITILLLVAGHLRHISIARVLDDPATLMILGLGTTAGVAAQALVLGVGLRRAKARLHWRWEPRHPAIRHVVRLSGWTFGMVAANQAALFAVLLLANSRPGGVSAYTYAYAFFQLPFGVVAVSITTARQPSWSAAWAAGELGGLREQVASGLRLLITFMVPIAIVLAALAHPLVSLLLGHGATGAAGVTSTAQVLAVLALGLPGFSAYLYFIRVYQAMQDLRSAFLLYLLNNGFTVVMALALYRPAGVQGIAAAVSAGYTLGAVAAGVTLRPRLGLAPGERLMMPVQALTRTVAASLPAGLLGWLTVRWTGAPTGLAALLPLIGGAAVAAVALALCWGRRALPGRGASDPARPAQPAHHPAAEEGREVGHGRSGHVSDEARRPQSARHPPHLAGLAGQHEGDGEPQVMPGQHPGESGS
ncbi:murein biosynthesis integral membrane protein MurJ [Streptomyces sp. NPDC020917]|uniref:murein biosynthesis integral membrane protein MurJ n=1 Tax=Streptomyces sp. NPDC020917 TaxID=3365102 RepID=UPI0037938273